MRYVIIGGSAAAISAVESIRRTDDRSTIDLFSDEETPLFSRVLLPYYVAEKLSKPLLNFRSADFFEENSVTPHLGVKVLEISPDERSIVAEDGKYPYDRLLIATGGNPIVPPIPGVNKQGISTLKTMADAERIFNYPARRAVVIGAGSIGVEACISLRRRGMRVTLLEQLGHVLPTVFDEESAAIIRKRIEDIGVEVVTGEKALEFVGADRVEKVITDNREIPCELVVVAVGVRPAVELAVKAGLDIGSLGGIKVDNLMRTSRPEIYAAGDVAETHDLARGTSFINAIWPCAFEQGRIAGLNMSGTRTPYAGSYRRNSIGNFIGIPAISMGLTQIDSCAAGSAEDEYREIKRQTKETYRKLILRNGRIIGAIFVGQTQKAGLMSMLLEKQVDVTDAIPVLMSSSLSFMDLLPVIRRNADKFPEAEFKEMIDTGL
ncbi:MAG: FAD-dependent oxidoreductase [Smithellaceae bacterium]|nr:FAD-dependent oxidoreductase [Smithellaceae bacterium]